MTELTFRADLYEASALRAASGVYAKVASCALEEGTEYHRLRITATGRVQEARIADELGNYALGTTIEGRTAPAEGKVSR